MGAFFFAKIGPVISYAENPARIRQSLDRCLYRAIGLPTGYSAVMTPQFLRYGVAGSVGTALQFVILVALVQFVRVPAVAASTLGAVAGAIVNYKLNHRWTFDSSRHHGHALPRFAAVALAGLLMNALVMSAMLRIVGAHYLAAQVVATGVVFLCAFFVNRSWTF